MPWRQLFPRWFPVHADWVLFFSRGELRMLAALLGLLFFLLVAGLHSLVVPGWDIDSAEILPDAVSAALVWLLFNRVLLVSFDRRRAILRQVQVIGEMNHHIRNALALIELSMYASGNREAIERIKSASARIQWTLREILPSMRIDETKE